MPAAIDPGRAAVQHDALAAAYREAGVRVHPVEPAGPSSPNPMCVAGSMFMTAAGAILGRSASTVRAGEERWVARRFVALGVPIVRSRARPRHLRGRGRDRARPGDGPGSMHLMGMLRVGGPDHAIAGPGRLAVAAVEARRSRGCRVLFLAEARTRNGTRR
jgi:hypothetical protein